VTLAKTQSSVRLYGVSRGHESRFVRHVGVEWHRLSRRLGFAASDDLVNDRTPDMQFEILGRSQLPSNLASPRIVPSGNILPTLAWSRELRSNAGTICESNRVELNQTLAGSIGRRWRWPIILFEESPMPLQSGRTRPEPRRKALTQNLAECIGLLAIVESRLHVQVMRGALMRTSEERLWSLRHVRGTVHRHLMGEPNRPSAL
jgi:hypothetical protein